jgi:hypothetical protein
MVTSNIQTNGAAAAAVSSKPIPISPKVRNSSNKNNNKSIPSTTHEWFSIHRIRLPMYQS